MRHLHLVKKITIHHLVRFDKFRQKEDPQIKNKKSALLPVRNVTLSGSMPCMSTQRTSKNYDRAFCCCIFSDLLFNFICLQNSDIFIW